MGALPIHAVAVSVVNPRPGPADAGVQEASSDPLMLDVVRDRDRDLGDVTARRLQAEVAHDALGHVRRRGNDRHESFGVIVIGCAERRRLPWLGPPPTEKKRVRRLSPERPA